MAVLFAVRAQKAPIRTGRESLVGRVGVVKNEIPDFGTGMVQVGGEFWGAERAEEGEPIPKGSRVEVVEVSGIRLRVREK